MAEVFVFGSSPELAAEALACVREAGHRAAVVTTGGQDAQDYRSLGCAEVVHVQGGNPLPEAYAADVAALLEERAACAFVVCGDATGRDMAARVAGILDAPMVSEASKLHIDGGGMSASRLAYGGAVVRCERIEGFGVVSVAPGAWAPLASDGAEAPIVAVDGNPDARMQLVEVQPLEKGGADLTKAERIVCAGMAFSTEDELGAAFRLAGALGAEVGCTRGLAEDHHWFPSYIGLSGAQVAPKLYVGLGVSGQVQHTVGIRGAQVVVAVNKDASAPIMSACDYAVAGDLFEVSDALAAALGS
ncbi:electron transfer flavoprotein subunit alpha/FixB family protein [Rubneribacter sp.]